MRDEYEAREKVLRDNYSFLLDTKSQGLAEGREEAFQLMKQVKYFYKTGKTIEEISSECNISVEEVCDILE